MLIAIAALTRNRVIGREGQIPWSLKGDMQHFREQTQGAVVVMGRSTFDSIGKPLPRRENWVLTRQSDWHRPGVRVFSDLQSLLAAAAQHPTVWVIGGEQVYRVLLPYCQRQWLTRIDQELEGDTFYPDYDQSQWQLLEQRPGPTGEAYGYDFCLYERR